MGNKETGVILTILFAIGAIIIFSKKLLVPFFTATSVVSGIVFLVFLLVGDLREKAHFPAIIMLISLILLGISSFIAYGLGGTAIGQAAVETNEAITKAQQEVYKALDESVTSLVDESCKTLDKQSCNSVKLAAASGKSIVELKTMIDQFKGTSKILKKGQDYLE